MHPLTVTWAPHIYTDWGWKNFQAWIHAGFDNYLCTPNGRVHRLLTRLAVENLFHPFQPFILGQKITGAEDGAAARHSAGLLRRERGRVRQSDRSDTDIGQARLDATSRAAGQVADLPRRHVGGRPDRRVRRATRRTWCRTCRPIRRRSSSKNVEVHYLGYYLKWHPQSCYYYAVEHGGFQASPERTPGTYSKYNSIDDRIDDFHYYTTFIKFGIGRATYDAAQEIRSRRHHPRRGRGARAPLRRRVPRALRRGNLPLPEHPREGIPGGIEDVRAADHGPRLLHASGRPLPLAAPVEVRGRRVEAAPHRLAAP